MAECAGTNFEWGQRCPDCNQITPKPISRTEYFRRRAAERDRRVYLWRDPSATYGFGQSEQGRVRARTRRRVN